MLCHRYPEIKELEYTAPKEETKTNPQFKILKDEINTNKSGFKKDSSGKEVPVDDKLWENVSRRNKSKHLHHIKGVNFGFRPTNAGLKMLEILFKFKMFQKRGKNKKNPVVRHFDNTSAPGNFVMATHYYMLHYTLYATHDWYASSYYGKEDSIKGLSGLDKKYPERLAMGPKNNGDVTNTDNLLDWEKNFPQNIDIYTSDLGFPLNSEEEYNEQERYHAYGNYGQILTGLLILNKKGILVAKMFTAHEPWTHSLFTVLAHVFTNFWLYKPVYSNPINTETYVIGCGFKGLAPALRESLLDSHRNFNFDRLLVPIDRKVESMTYKAMSNLRNISGLYLQDLIRIYHDLRENPEKQKEYSNYLLNVDRSKERDLFTKIFPRKFESAQFSLL